MNISSYMRRSYWVLGKTLKIFLLTPHPYKEQLR